jgi:uncharacterized protein with FMN-binding domain
MKGQEHKKVIRKGKRKMTGWIIFFAIVALLGTGGAVGWSKLSKEHMEARSLPLNAVDFSNLKDGVYRGVYEGGMYKWRENEIQVTVSSGKVTDIVILKHKENWPKENTDELFRRVKEAQTLQVDVISGATLTSKAYLQGVENALIQAERR